MPVFKKMKRNGRPVYTYDPGEEHLVLDVIAQEQGIDAAFREADKLTDAGNDAARAWREERLASPCASDRAERDAQEKVWAAKRVASWDKTSPAPAPAHDPLDSWNAAVKKFADDRDINDQALAAERFLNTDEGRTAKRAYDATRAYATADEATKRGDAQAAYDAELKKFAREHGIVDMLAANERFLGTTSGRVAKRAYNLAHGFDASEPRSSTDSPSTVNDPRDAAANFSVELKKYAARVGVADENAVLERFLGTPEGRAAKAAYNRACGGA